MDSDLTLQCRNEVDERFEEDSLDDISVVGDIKEMEGDFSAAARPDDVEAEPGEWDRWSVLNFVSSRDKPALICHGDYDESKHSRLFNGFRRLLERRYRRNVLRSF